MSGFRGRNLVGSLLDRLSVKAGGLELSRRRVESGDPEALLRNFAGKRDITVWLLVDDIDATFVNAESERGNVSAFFSACRNLVNSVEGLNIRASVRTDVWSVLSYHDEALDKCEQYMLDLQWSTAETGQILSNKISSFLIRTYSSLPTGGDPFAIIFKQPFLWGTRKVPASGPIHLLSRGRPRWATQLCRLAARQTMRSNRHRITVGDVTDSLAEYGRLRLADLYKEHRHQCEQLRILVEAFAGGTSLFYTPELLARIDRTIIRRFGMPNIDDSKSPDGAMAVAAFLYRIGFISARTDGPNASLVHFEDCPHL